MHAIRRLAREIHRRSVWQVLGVYLAGGWVGYRGVAVATGQVGLPRWTPGFALVLLALGLPVVLATAAVQGGIPWLRIEDAADPNDLEGLTPEQVHVVPEAHPLVGEGILTWRNAVLGGVMALALLIGSVVAYLTMWALGIGPVGSLLAQGLVSEGDELLLVEFENRTDAAGLGRAVTAAFGADLSESRLFTLVDAERVAEGLARLGEPAPSAPLTSPLARELAAAEGIRVLLEGEIRRDGGAYRLSARIVLLPGDSPVSQFHERVLDDGALVPAIDLLAERVRLRLGEPLRAIREAGPLVDRWGAELETSAQPSRPQLLVEGHDLVVVLERHAFDGGQILP